MKKIIVIIALILAPALSFGQSIFDKLEIMDNVSSVIFNKDAFQLMSKFNLEGEKNEGVEIFKMIQNLEVLKLFTTQDASVAKKMDGMVNTAINQMNLTQLMRAKDKDASVKIYVKTGKNKERVSEVLMYVTGTNEQTNGKVSSLVLSLTGDIDINKLSDLADKFTKNNTVKVNIN